MNLKSVMRLSTALLIAAMVGFVPVSASAQTTVKIGIINSLTGPLGDGGKEMQMGMDLYAKLHTKDLPAGVKLEFIARDDKTDGPTGKKWAQEMITEHKVNMLVGFMGSPIAAQVAPLTVEAKLPMIIANAAGVSLTRMSPYVARLSFTQWQMSLPLGRAAGQSFKTGYSLVADFIPGHDAEAAFVKGFAEGGGKVLSSVRFPMGTQDFGPFLKKVVEANPEALFIFVPGGRQATEMVKAVKAMGLIDAGINIVSMQDLLPDEELPNMGDAPTGLITTGNYSTAAVRAANTTFLAAWKKEYGDWDAMAAAFAVIIKTNGKFTGDEAMEILKNYSNPNSPRGPISIDSNTRDIIQNIYLRRTEMKDGKLQNTELATIPNVKDPWKELNPAPSPQAAKP
jgi:branched-chain amino acid transport system substrate-binding protein